MPGILDKDKWCVLLKGKAIVRLKLRGCVVGPFDTFDMACGWVDDNTAPDDDVILCPITDPAALQASANAVAA